MSSFGIRVICANDHRGVLHLDLDLVPCVAATSIEQTLANLLGSSTLAPPETIASNIKGIAQALRGLHVQCKYKPGAKTVDGREKATILVDDQIIARGHKFQIKDIKMAADVCGFEYGPEKMEYTIYEYFSQGEYIQSLDL